jgi:CO/xanthine dehydrogenase Mo-binding subunit
MTSNYSTIGQSIPKIGVNERLRGEPIFSADLAFADALVLKVLRSTKAHARIVGINYDQALKLKGHYQQGSTAAGNRQGAGRRRTRRTGGG